MGWSVYVIVAFPSHTHLFFTGTKFPIYIFFAKKEGDCDANLSLLQGES